MTKFYTFIQKILKLKRKLSARLGYGRINSIYRKTGANQAKKILQIRSNEKLMEKLQKKYRTRDFASKNYEKWI